MSTAFGHGLVDPKRWGKPVSFANKVGRTLGLMEALGLFLSLLLEPKPWGHRWESRGGAQSFGRLRAKLKKR